MGRVRLITGDSLKGCGEVRIINAWRASNQPFSQIHSELMLSLRYTSAIGQRATFTGPSAFVENQCRPRLWTDCSGWFVAHTQLI